MPSAKALYTVCESANCSYEYFRIGISNNTTISLKARPTAPKTFHLKYYTVA